MKRLDLQNKRAVVLRMAYRGQNCFGTFEERASILRAYADKQEALQPLHQSEAKIFQTRPEYED